MGTRICRGIATLTRLASSVIALAVWGLSASTVHAQNPYTWNNGTTTSFTGDWNVAGNWRDAGNNPGVPPSSATTELAFGGTGDYTSTNNTLGNFTLNRLTSTNSGLVLLDGNPLRFDGTSPLLSQTVANTAFNISNNVRLETNTTFRATNGGFLNVGVAVGGQVDLNRNNLTLDVGANSTITLGRVGVTTLIGDVEGSGSVTITGANNTDARVILIGNALHADGVNLQSGRLLVGSNQSLGFGPLIVNGPGAASLGNVLATNVVLTNEMILGKDLSIGSSTGSLRINGQGLGRPDIDLGSVTRTLTVTGSVEFDGVVGGTGGLTKAGAGTLTLGVSNSYSGPTTVNAGTLRLASPFGNSATGSGNVVINNGGTVALIGDGSSAAPLITVNAGGILNVTGRTNALGLASGQTLRGTGTATSGATASRMILGSQSVTVASGAAVQAGDGFATGVVVVESAGGVMTFASGSELKLRIVGGSPSNILGGSGNSPATNSLFVMNGSGTLTFTNGMEFDFDGTGLGPAPPGSAFSYRIGTGPTRATDLTLTSANVTFSTTGFVAQNQSILYESDGKIYFNFSLAPVPEPASVLAVCFGAAAAIRVLRRRTTASLPRPAAS